MYMQKNALQKSINEIRKYFFLKKYMRSENIFPKEVSDLSRLYVPVILPMIFL